MSPRETVAELMRMMPRRVAIMILVINRIITGNSLIEGAYFHSDFVYAVAILHDQFTHIDQVYKIADKFCFVLSYHMQVNGWNWRASF
jgi:hypothetical protein